MIIELNQNYLKISDQRDLLIKVQSPEVHLDYEVSTDTRVIIINDAASITDKPDLIAFLTFL